MEYDGTTALLVVDVQNDFADPMGSLYVSGAETLLSGINDEIEKAIAAGAPVFYTQDWHPESTPHFKKDGGIWPQHCVGDTWGAEFHPELVVKGEVIKKGTGGEDGYSGFTVRAPESGEESPTGLDQMLEERGIKKVTIIGLATDYCVKETALDAVTKGYAPTVIKNLVKGVNMSFGDDQEAFKEIEKAGGTLE
jgi:nicotinamidase/pyrazinamidase